MKLARHSYPARAANCLNADWPDVSNCCLRFMWATSRPSSVAEADLKDLNPFICRVNFLMKRWSCSIMLFRYLTCSTSISQNYPFKFSKRFMFCTPARLSPILSITTLSEKPLLPITRVTNAVAAASSRCSASMKSRVFQTFNCSVIVCPLAFDLDIGFISHPAGHCTAMSREGIR